MSEREEIDALLACLPLSDDGTGHVVDCGYDDEAMVCGCFTLPERLGAVLRAHDDRIRAEALAPVLALADEWEADGGAEPFAWLALRAAAGTPTHDTTEEERGVGRLSARDELNLHMLATQGRLLGEAHPPVPPVAGGKA
jgi:hypothetical protein